MKGATVDIDKPFIVGGISIRAPNEGSDLKCDKLEMQVTISIRAPNEGSDE